jgi:SAM-dependent methyltransferase
MDTNTGDFGQFEFDWAINHAAFHHIAFLDRAVRNLAKAMKPEGLLICYDYTGPDRNQYPWEVWSAMLELNELLPEQFKANMNYPHMPTILHSDPTEAVHSSDILKIVSRYFRIKEIRPLGGALAYELLYGNKALHVAQHTDLGRETINMIIAADETWTNFDPEKSFFNFWVAAPYPKDQHSQVQLDAWTAEEAEREERASANNMRYAPPNALELIYNRLSDLKDALAVAKRLA